MAPCSELQPIVDFRTGEGVQKVAKVPFTPSYTILRSRAQFNMTDSVIFQEKRVKKQKDPSLQTPPSLPFLSLFLSLCVCVCACVCLCCACICLPSSSSLISSYLSRLTPRLAITIIAEVKRRGWGAAKVSHLRDMTRHQSATSSNHPADRRRVATEHVTVMSASPPQPR